MFTPRPEKVNREAQNEKNIEKLKFVRVSTTGSKVEISLDMVTTMLKTKSDALMKKLVEQIKIVDGNNLKALDEAIIKAIKEFDKKKSTPVITLSQLQEEGTSIIVPHAIIKKR